MPNYEKRGYLNSSFRLFHLTDQKKQDFEYHYHDFDKIILFLQGNVTYRIEGCAYTLKPYDIIFVNQNALHKPEIDPLQPYERIIVYLSPGFLNAYRCETYDLGSCFDKAKELRSYVLRIHSMEKSSLYRCLRDLEHICTHGGYAKDLHCQVLFLEFMIQLNQAALEGQVKYLPPASCDQRILNIIDFINGHLTEEISVDAIAKTAYISRYHLMRLFKAETGCTLFDYIAEKRLSLAKDLLKAKTPVIQACFGSGFQNYSTFSRAYKKRFGISPSQTGKSHENT